MPSKNDLAIGLIIVFVVFVITAFGITVHRHSQECPLDYVDNGSAILTISDGDMPVGPCNLGDLVRASVAYLDGVPVNWAEPGIVTIRDGGEDLVKNGKLMRALQAELARCEPREKK